MSAIYLDTSALLKRYVQEQGSDELEAWIVTSSVTGTVKITYAEIAAALAKLKRMQWLNADDAHVAWENFSSEYPFFVHIEVTEPVIDLAADLAWEHGLRGYDAVHLAAALLWKTQAGEDIQMVTFDKQLWEVAKIVGLKRLPEDIEKYRQ